MSDRCACGAKTHFECANEGCEIEIPFDDFEDDDAPIIISEAELKIFELESDDSEWIENEYLRIRNANH